MASTNQRQADVKPVATETAYAVAQDALEALVPFSVPQFREIFAENDRHGGRPLQDRGSLQLKTALVRQGARQMLMPALNEKMDQTFLNRFVEGLATRDFEPALRLRTHTARRFKRPRSGVCLVYQMMARLSRNRRQLKSAQRCPTIPLPGGDRKKAKRSA